MEARQIDYVRLQAEDMGLRLEFCVDAIEVHVADDKKYPGFVKDARLFSAYSVEELSGWMNGWGMGWTYAGLSKQEADKEGLAIGAGCSSSMFNTQREETIVRRKHARHSCIHGDLDGEEAGRVGHR